MKNTENTLCCCCFVKTAIVALSLSAEGSLRVR